MASRLGVSGFPRPARTVSFLAAGSITNGAWVIDSPILAQVHVLVATEITNGPWVFETPYAAQVGNTVLQEIVMSVNTMGMH